MSKSYHFPKGVSPNPGGKPKDGSARKLLGLRQKARLNIKEKLDNLNFDPFLEMVKMYRNPNTKDRYKVEILIDLCNYIAPKLKSVEFVGDPAKPFVINLNTTSGQKREALDAIYENVVEEEGND